MKIDMDIEIEKTLISCIVSRKGGIPLQELNEDFKMLTGYSIPFLSLGYPNLLSFISTVKDLYVVKNEEYNDIVIVDSSKSRYMKQLVEKQNPIKRKRKAGDNSFDLDYTLSSIQTNTSSQTNYNFKRRKSTLLRKNTMEMLTPVVYGHQLMGDDIFLEVAENHLMVSVHRTAPKRCGLCITGQTIEDLIDNIEQQTVLPHGVAILIGLTDLLAGKNSTEMINDMELLITVLKHRKIHATISTLPKLACIPKRCYSALRAFNDYIMSMDGTRYISVMDLQNFYSWMACKTCESKPRSSKFLLHESEREVILFGLKDYFTFMSREQ